MTTREEVADLLYRNEYPDPASPGIQPLAERAQWEQDMIYRGADAVMGLLAEAWEVGVIHGHNAEGRLIDKREANPYSAQAQVDGL